MLRKSRPPLTKARRLQADAAGGATFKGKPLGVSAKAEERYVRGLTKAVGQMTAAAEAAVRELYRDHGAHLTASNLDAMDASVSSQARILSNNMAARFQAFFARLAPILAARMFQDVNASSKAQLHASLKEVSGGLSLKTSVITPAITEAMKAGVQANIALIKSIPQKYLTDLQGEIFRSIQVGNGLQDVLSHIEALGVAAKGRAKLIAKDQTSKATTALNSARMNALGIQEFEWLHSAGGKTPRPLHIGALNRRIFRLDAPPVIDEKTGERGLPGQLLHCRCRMRPIIRFGTGGGDDGASS